MKLSKTIILLLLMLFYGTSYILSASKDSEDERIHLMEYLMDNNLGYSQEVRLRDIAQWENELVEVFRSRKDYKYMFLMQQMAVYALVSDGHINGSVGGGQISEVVQSNAAIAEESSATSQELSAESASLNDLVQQFKLK